MERKVPIGSGEPFAGIIFRPRPNFFLKPLRKKKIPKRFEEKCATYLECETIIREAWSIEPPEGSPMF